MRFIVSAPKPFEDLLAQELTALSITPTGTDGSSVSFEGELEDAYQVVLYSRVATRIVLELARGPVDTPDDVYSLVKSVDWSEHLAPAGTLSVNYQGTGAGIRNTQFGGQKVKDAIVDQFREKAFGRPDVDPKRPDLSISARFRSGELSVGFDLGGGSLHRRGYRPRTIEAPLKENLAAALLMRAGWPREQVLLDPMCGSGTLLVEAAMMAFDIAPGLMRPALGFGKWLGHDRELWNRLRSKAKARRDDAPRHAEILGADVDERAIRAAEEAVMRASLEGAIKLECRDARSWAPKLSGDALLISNLPYGERLGEAGPELRGLYRESGQFWRESFHGGRFALLVPKDDLSHHLP
ncbi:MAG: THUMP domain-containing protein, partial [Myxococcota bacterium]